LSSKNLIAQNLVIPIEDSYLVETILENWKEIAELCVIHGYYLDLTKDRYLILDKCSDLNFVKIVENFIVDGSHMAIKRGKKVVGYLIA
jgi:hypothetical protein